MKTRQELIDWLEAREKECVDLHYQLIDSLNEPEIDSNVRKLRGIVWNFEQEVNNLKEMIKIEVKFPDQYK